MYFPKYFQAVAFACVEQPDAQDEYTSTFYLPHPLLNLYSRYLYESLRKVYEEKKKRVVQHLTLFFISNEVVMGTGYKQETLN